MKSPRVVKSCRHLLPSLFLGLVVVQRVVVPPPTLAASADKDETLAEGDGSRVKGSREPQRHLRSLPPLHMAEGKDLDGRVSVAT